MKEIYIIRHGQTDYNLTGRVQGSGIDAPLNETGQRQADAFYESYKNAGFDKIYTSILQRTTQTVKGFIEAGIPFEKHKGLNEISWGSMEGIAFTELDNGYFEKVIAQWRNGETNVPIGKGESPEEVAQRQKEILELILSRKDEKKVLICMHGRAMRILLCQLFDKPLKEMDDFPHHNVGVYHLLLSDDGKLEMLLENCMKHLDGID
jgi:probable phosphoglycerate mutase